MNLSILKAPKQEKYEDAVNQSCLLPNLCKNIFVAALLGLILLSGCTPSAVDTSKAERGAEQSSPSDSSSTIFYMTFKDVRVSEFFVDDVLLPEAQKTVSLSPGAHTFSYKASFTYGKCSGEDDNPFTFCDTQKVQCYGNFQSVDNAHYRVKASVNLATVIDTATFLEVGRGKCQVIEEEVEALG